MGRDIYMIGVSKDGKTIMDNSECNELYPHRDSDLFQYILNDDSFERGVYEKIELDPMTFDHYTKDGNNLGEIMNRYIKVWDLGKDFRYLESQDFAKLAKELYKLDKEAILQVGFDM